MKNIIEVKIIIVHDDSHDATDVGELFCDVLETTLKYDARLVEVRTAAYNDHTLYTKDIDGKLAYALNKV